jgi:Rps23 Pro-64 3,4-dihydroxylase Tpa1-like proline 4-hydroxylase
MVENSVEGLFLMLNREQYASLILARLEEELPRLREDFPEQVVQSCYIDNLLPKELALEIFEAFPDKSTMTLKKSLRENKYVAAQMNRYAPILEEIVYAFQDPRLLKTVTEITGIQGMVPDDRLYAGGISLMAHGNFLNPHLDNSHDKDRERYRVLNLLYYVTPDWSHEQGGNLELWDDGPKGVPREITSHFNRLALMATHEKSWHSVSEVKVDRSRCCVSNYYFSAQPLEKHEYFHVTSFRGRPEQHVRDLVLQGDIALRQGLRKVFKKGIVENKHVYDKSQV